MTDKELWHATTLSRYRFDSIPKKVFDKYRAECAEMAAWLMQEAAAFKNLAESTGTPPDINAQPESFEDQDELDELMSFLVEQAEIGKEIADGKLVTLEVTPEQWCLLNKHNLLTRNAATYFNKYRAMGSTEFQLLIPSGIVCIEVKPSPESD